MEKSWARRTRASYTDASPWGCRYDQLRIEITTYENNLGFFNTASKKGNSLVEEMNRKIEKLKADLEMVKQKIKAIDAEKK